jgi:RNA polymerase sigma-70 factor (ECF subfamily)
MKEDAALIARLSLGDEAAFTELVRANHGRLVRLARGFCRGSRATAEEVVQDSWIAVITGLSRYTGEAPLRAWIAGIVVNKARTRAARDARLVPFSALVREELGELEPDAAWFGPDGHWAVQVDAWQAVTPERLAGDRELLRRLLDAIDALPAAQRAVVLLRDVEGHDGGEVARILGLTEGNMRVLLHRGRTRLRATLEPLRRSPYVTRGQPARDNDATAIAGGAAGS